MKKEAAPHMGLGTLILSNNWNKKNSLRRSKQLDLGLLCPLPMSLPLEQCPTLVTGLDYLSQKWTLSAACSNTKKWSVTVKVGMKTGGMNCIILMPRFLFLLLKAVSPFQQHWYRSNMYWLSLLWKLYTELLVVSGGRRTPVADQPAVLWGDAQSVPPFSILEGWLLAPETHKCGLILGHPGLSTPWHPRSGPARVTKDLLLTVSCQTLIVLFPPFHPHCKGVASCFLCILVCSQIVYCLKKVVTLLESWWAAVNVYMVQCCCALTTWGALK